MRKYIFVLLALVACTTSSQERAVDQWMDETSRIRVLSTIGMVDDLVRVVGGDRVARLVLIGSSLDPHSYELVKGDDEKLAHADLIFYNGLGLEHGPSLARSLRENGKAVAIGEAISAGDSAALVRIDGEIDPHIWMDVSLWQRGIDVVVAKLSARDPVHAEEYRRRGEEARETLLDLDTELRVTLESVPLAKRYVVTSHDSCNYFARRYLATPSERASGRWLERCISPEGLAPDAQLSVIDIREVVDHLATYNISVVFPESNLSQDSIRKLLDAGRQKGMEIRIADEPLYGDAMGEEGSGCETYEGMMRHNAQVMARSLCG